MDTLKTVNVSAVQNTWAIVNKDLNTHAPHFYVALLTAHPEYQPMFPTIANVPAGELLNNAALKTLSVNVLTKLSELIGCMGNPDALNAQLVDLANQHKGRGTTRAHFDNLSKVLIDFLAAKLGGEFTPEARQAWTATMQGINTVVEASSFPEYKASHVETDGAHAFYLPWFILIFFLLHPQLYAFHSETLSRHGTKMSISFRK